jgi:glutathione synthase/RimK-type ligase-like ATP-grasp enzyme
MRVRIFPYNPGSQSAKLLSGLTGWLRLKTVGSGFRPTAGDVIVNWGSTRCPDFGCRVLNTRESIIAATNKLTALERLKNAGVKVPEFYTSYTDLVGRLNERGGRKTKWVARSVLTGHSGDGITVSESGSLGGLPQDAPLYTRYIRKSDEFRVHVVGGKVVFTQRKARRRECENPNWEVRNLEGGFVYVEYPTREGGLSEIAVKAVEALGLDFGAVDVLLSREDEDFYVLEVNTACGLEERTAEKYAEALKELVNGR